jgi:bifunctional non-homologous end joining protein LigD
MGLTEYKQKRSFNKTPEPGPKVKSPKNTLKFVVQKHAATSLHYDFRLEMEGVLKSWAVPKGPSLNPEDKRLAMMVEDHPYDYKDFEGTIPEGNYGAGTVIVWDEGDYGSMDHEDESKKEQEKILLAQLSKGDVKVVLHGKKLKGAFALVKMKGRGENAWLLIKKKDKWATDKDVTQKNKSVKSAKTIEQLSKDKNAKEWISNKKATRTKSTKKSLVKKTPKPILLPEHKSKTVKKKSRR